MELERIDVAVLFLKENKSFRVGDLRFGMIDGKNMFVTGWTEYSNIENINKEIAVRELSEIKLLFTKMIKTSLSLKEFIKDKAIKYNLAFNYGMGSYGICSEKDGVIKWEYENLK